MYIHIYGNFQEHCILLMTSCNDFCILHSYDNLTYIFIFAYFVDNLFRDTFLIGFTYSLRTQDNNTRIS